MIKKATCDGTESTKELAKSMASFLKSEDIVLFYGDLGAGKTFFIKSICGSLGIPEDLVVSPSFSIVKTYELEEKDLHIHHFDFYRMGDSGEVDFFEFEDYLGEKNIIFVEWANKLVKASFQGRVITVKINIINDTKREFIIEPWMLSA